MESSIIRARPSDRCARGDRCTHRSVCRSLELPSQCAPLLDWFWSVAIGESHELMSGGQEDALRPLFDSLSRQIYACPRSPSRPISIRFQFSNASYGAHQDAALLWNGPSMAPPRNSNEPARYGSSTIRRGEDRKDLQRKPDTEFNRPCSDYLGHNPLLAMARLYEQAKIGGH